MKKPTLKGLTKEQAEYIEYLESIVDGQNSLSEELNITCGVIALEIKEMRLKGSILDDDRKFEKILKLIDKRTKLESDKKKESKSIVESDDKVESKEAQEIENIFEKVSNKVKNNLNGTK